MSSLAIFNEPQCLIDTGADGRLVALRDTIEDLKQLDKPLVIISVAGLYRTGKSYLMNRLAGVTEGKKLKTTFICTEVGFLFVTGCLPIQKVHLSAWREIFS